jgi:hypothetical protein
VTWTCLRDVLAAARRTEAVGEKAMTMASQEERRVGDCRYRIWFVFVLIIRGSQLPFVPQQTYDIVCATKILIGQSIQTPKIPTDYSRVVCWHFL